MQTITLAIALLLVAFWCWMMAFGQPASDIDRADLIKAAGDDVAAQDFVRSVLSRRRLQRRHVAVARRQVAGLVRAAEAKATVQSFMR